MPQPTTRRGAGEFVGTVHGVKGGYSVQQDRLKSVDLSLQNENLVANSTSTEEWVRVAQHLVNFGNQAIEPGRSRVGPRLQAGWDRQIQ
jgi:hypothetical protein